MSDKDKSLMAADKVAKKKYPHAIALANEMTYENHPVYSTGNLQLDRALGGGFAEGRIYEVFGPESGGKTTLCLQAIAEVQRQGGHCLFVDAERAMNQAHAKSLGVDMSKLRMATPADAEQALSIIELYLRTGAISMIVLDSLAAMTPRNEAEKGIEKNTVGEVPRLMSKFFRTNVGPLESSKTTLVIINQVRMKIGVMFGNPETTPGGNAMKFFSSGRLNVRRKGWIKDGDRVVGQTIGVQTIKNKMAPPMQTALLDFYFDKGLDKIQDVRDMALSLPGTGIIMKGSWLSVDGEQIGQGKTMLDELLSDPKIYANVYDRCLKVMKHGDNPPDLAFEPLKLE